MDILGKIKDSLNLDDEEFVVFSSVALYYPFEKKNMIERLTFFAKLHTTFGMCIFYDLNNRSVKLKKLMDERTILNDALIKIDEELKDEALIKPADQERRKKIVDKLMKLNTSIEDVKKEK